MPYYKINVVNQELYTSDYNGNSYCAVYECILTQGQSYRFYSLYGHETYGYRDPKIWLYDANRNLLANDDDFGGSRNFDLTFNCTKTGKYYICVGFYSRGTKLDSIIELSSPIELLEANGALQRLKFLVEDEVILKTYERHTTHWKPL